MIPLAFALSAYTIAATAWADDWVITPTTPNAFD
jgi:hypothetical protein